MKKEIRLNRFEFCGTILGKPKEHERLTCRKLHDWGVLVEYETLDSHPDIRERGRKMSISMDPKQYRYHSQEEAIKHFYLLLGNKPKKDNDFYVLALVVAVAWGIMYFVLGTPTPIIHVLLAVALILLALGMALNYDKSKLGR